MELCLKKINSMELDSHCAVRDEDLTTQPNYYVWDEKFFHRNKIIHTCTVHYDVSVVCVCLLLGI